jgi:hypothetical protein
VHVNSDVTNVGEFKVSKAIVEFTGTFTNRATLSSDPSTLTFNNLSVDSTGVIKAMDDTYIINGNFLNNSARASEWDTTQAKLVFSGNPTDGHRLALAGADLGESGYTQNFSWGTFDVTGVTEVSLEDGNPYNTGTALYTGAALGMHISETSDTDITNIWGNGYNIYYLTGAVGNEYLGGKTYNLVSSGKLVGVVPEPISCLLFVLGGGALAGVRRFRRKL